MTNNTATEIAMKMTIIDAIENGHTDPIEMIVYMSTETFKNSVKSYKTMLLEQFANNNNNNDEQPK